MENNLLPLVTPSSIPSSPDSTSSPPEITPLTARNLWLLGELSPLVRFLQEEPDEDASVVFSRTAAERIYRPVTPSTTDRSPTAVSGSSRHVLSPENIEKPDFLRNAPPRRQQNGPRPARMRGQPLQPELSGQAIRLLICQAIATNFMIYGYEKYRSRPSGSVRSRNGGTGGDPNSSTTSGKSLLPSGSRKRAFQASGTDQGASGSSKQGGVKISHKRSRLAPLSPLLYACPFYRQNPDNHEFGVGETYHKCKIQGIKTDKLKQHIRRVHTKPAQCPVCGRRGDPGEIKFHTENISCVSRGVIEGVDAVTLHKERLLTNRRNTTWHQIFNILFPNHLPIPSEADQYFRNEATNEATGEVTNEEAEMTSQRLAATLAAQLEQTSTVLEALIRSPEYRGVVPSSRSTTPGSPEVMAAAARLMAIISSITSAVDPPTPVAQMSTVPDHTVSPDPGFDATPATLAAETEDDPSPTATTTVSPGPTPRAPLDVQQTPAGDDVTMADQNETDGAAGPPQLLSDFESDFDSDFGSGFDWRIVNWDPLINGSWLNPDTPGDGGWSPPTA